MKRQTSQNFLTGAFILILANALVKVIGAIYKLPMSNLIGGAGNGIFSVAYNIYTALFVISTAGLPVAVSKMVSEANALGRVAETKKIFRVAFSAFFIVGAVSTTLLIVFARPFTERVGNTMAYYSVLTIAPSLFFVAISSTIRGYYQGLSNMVPTAVSQVIEALCKLLIGLGLVRYLLGKGYPLEVGVAGAIGGVTIGTALSALYLCIKRAREPVLVPFGSDSLNVRSRREIFGDLIRIALPITVGSSVLSLTNLIDMFVVLNRLQQIGYSEEGANLLYGTYNMALTLFNLPQTLVVAVSISIIPAISAAYARRSYEKAEKTTESALRLASIIALPCAAGLFALAEPIMLLLYPQKPEDAIAGAPMLTILSVAVIFVAMVSLTNSTLQATGLVNVPVVTMLIGGVVKLAVNYTLVGMPKMNIHGAPVGTTCCYATITILNCIYLVRNTRISLRFSRIFLRPMAASLLMGAGAWSMYHLFEGVLGGRLSTAVSIVLSVAVYGILLLLFRGLTREDVLLMPRGEKIADFLKLR